MFSKYETRNTSYSSETPRTAKLYAQNKKTSILLEVKNCKHNIQEDL